MHLLFGVRGFEETAFCRVGGGTYRNGCANTHPLGVGYIYIYTPDFVAASRFRATGFCFVVTLEMTVLPTGTCEEWEVRLGMREQGRWLN